MQYINLREIKDILTTEFSVSKSNKQIREAKREQKSISAFRLNHIAEIWYQQWQFWARAWNSRIISKPVYGKALPENHSSSMENKRNTDTIERGYPNKNFAQLDSK